MRRSQVGMTLVEVTVASVIFAMIMLAVVTATRTFGQTHERLYRFTEQTSQKREVDRFLRYALQDALPEAGYFDGSSSDIRWVAPIDRAGSAGGLQHLKLEASGKELVLKFAPFDRFGDPQDEPNWGAEIEAVALIDNLEQFELSYRAVPEDEWSSSLELDDQSRAAIPWGVQIQIASNGKPWPPVIVAFPQFSGVR